MTPTRHALPGQYGPIHIAGTSFSAADVFYLAALLRQRFPELTAAQIKRTNEREGHSLITIDCPGVSR